ncbi:VOC family protein [Paracidovorax wautersii]|uniref:Catechol 2,3-dioxygenase-like lactoylglutathione lyase family enzyme n=1 Tax=Paracidovorax wautersii TaxID=1177982 RepID=A0ABU1I840_9BURK|nr:VOC family protein [Paracidovorax wautersii]MDR6213370.1 catechol 2,3-dioxygenase-like lactoylglutathione lyase family enzyme [Paracidovorax wautersii]
MTRPLDHVVIAVHDLDRTVQDYRALGFTVYPGGQHPGRTSHNALVVLADGAYLELIAWRGPAPQERWWRTLQAAGEGLVDFALQTPDAAADLAAAHARGLASLHGPVDGGRVRPDGERLQWRTARHDTPDVPFLCGDLTPRRLRVPDDAAVQRHANGATGVERLALVVHDIDATLGRWRALLGEEGAVPSAATDDALAGLRTATVALDGFTVDLATPAEQPTPAQPVAGMLRERLSHRGEGLCALVLRGISSPWSVPGPEHGLALATPWRAATRAG